MFSRFARKLNKKRNKKGFTLMECIVSVTIFTIMATLFATFIVSSIRVVNLSITNNTDRELLREAIAAAGNNPEKHIYESNTIPNGKVTVEAKLDNGDPLTLVIDVNNTKMQLDNGKYLLYVTNNGRKYCIYIGDEAEAQKPEDDKNNTVNGKSRSADNVTP